MMRTIAVALLLICGIAEAAFGRESAPVVVVILDAEYQAKQTATPDLPDSLSQQSITIPVTPPIPPKPPRSRRLLVLTADWCGPCQTIKPHLNSLAANGWAVGDGADAQFQIVDIDSGAGKQTLAEFGTTAGSIPRFVLVENGRVVSSRVGFMDAFAMASYLMGRQIR